MSDNNPPEIPEDQKILPGWDPIQNPLDLDPVLGREGFAAPERALPVGYGGDTGPSRGFDGNAPKSWWEQVPTGSNPSTPEVRITADGDVVTASGMTPEQEKAQAYRYADNPEDDLLGESLRAIGFEASFLSEANRYQMYQQRRALRAGLDDAEAKIQQVQELGIIDYANISDEELADVVEIIDDPDMSVAQNILAVAEYRTRDYDAKWVQDYNQSGLFHQEGAGLDDYSGFWGPVRGFFGELSGSYGRVKKQREMWNDLSPTDRKRLVENYDVQPPGFWFESAFRGDDYDYTQEESGFLTSLKDAARAVTGVQWSPVRAAFNALDYQWQESQKFYRAREVLEEQSESTSREEAARQGQSEQRQGRVGRAIGTVLDTLGGVEGLDDFYGGIFGAGQTIIEESFDWLRAQSAWLHGSRRDQFEDVVADRGDAAFSPVAVQRITETHGLQHDKAGQAMHISQFLDPSLAGNPIFQVADSESTGQNIVNMMGGVAVVGLGAAKDKQTKAELDAIEADWRQGVDAYLEEVMPGSTPDVVDDRARARMLLINDPALKAAALDMNIQAKITFGRQIALESGMTPGTPEFNVASGTGDVLANLLLDPVTLLAGPAKAARVGMAGTKLTRTAHVMAKSKSVPTTRLVFDAYNNVRTVPGVGRVFPQATFGRGFTRAVDDVAENAVTDSINARINARYGDETDLGHAQGFDHVARNHPRWTNYYEQIVDHVWSRVEEKIADQGIEAVTRLDPDTGRRVLSVDGVDGVRPQMVLDWMVGEAGQTALQEGALGGWSSKYRTLPTMGRLNVRGRARGIVDAVDVVFEKPTKVVKSWAEQGLLDDRGVEQITKVVSRLAGNEGVEQADVAAFLEDLNLARIEGRQLTDASKRWLRQQNVERTSEALEGAAEAARGRAGRTSREYIRGAAQRSLSDQSWVDLEVISMKLDQDDWLGAIGFNSTGMGGYTNLSHALTAVKAARGEDFGKLKRLAYGTGAILNSFLHAPTGVLRSLMVNAPVSRVTIGALDAPTTLRNMASLMPREQAAIWVNRYVNATTSAQKYNVAQSMLLDVADTLGMPYTNLGRAYMERNMRALNRLRQQRYLHDDPSNFVGGVRQSEPLLDTDIDLSLPLPDLGEMQRHADRIHTASMLMPGMLVGRIFNNAAMDRVFGHWQRAVMMRTSMGLRNAGEEATTGVIREGLLEPFLNRIAVSSQSTKPLLPYWIRGDKLVLRNWYRALIRASDLSSANGASFRSVMARALDLSEDDITILATSTRAGEPAPGLRGAKRKMWEAMAQRNPYEIQGMQVLGHVLRQFEWLKTKPWADAETAEDALAAAAEAHRTADPELVVVREKPHRIAEQWRRLQEAIVPDDILAAVRRASAHRKSDSSYGTSVSDMMADPEGYYGDARHRRLHEGREPDPDRITRDLVTEGVTVKMQKDMANPENRELWRNDIDRFLESQVGGIYVDVLTDEALDIGGRFERGEINQAVFVDEMKTEIRRRLLENEELMATLRNGTERLHRTRSGKRVLGNTDEEYEDLTGMAADIGADARWRSQAAREAGAGETLSMPPEETQRLAQRVQDLVDEVFEPQAAARRVIDEQLEEEGWEIVRASTASDVGLEGTPIGRTVHGEKKIYVFDGQIEEFWQRMTDLAEQRRQAIADNDGVLPDGWDDQYGTAYMKEMGVNWHDFYVWLDSRGGADALAEKVLWHEKSHAIRHHGSRRPEGVDQLGLEVDAETSALGLLGFPKVHTPRDGWVADLESSLWRVEETRGGLPGDGLTWFEADNRRVWVDEDAIRADYDNGMISLTGESEQARQHRLVLERMGIGREDLYRWFELNGGADAYVAFVRLREQARAMLAQQTTRPLTPAGVLDEVDAEEVAFAALGMPFGSRDRVYQALHDLHVVKPAGPSPQALLDQRLGGLLGRFGPDAVVNRLEQLASISRTAVNNVRGNTFNKTRIRTGWMGRKLAEAGFETDDLLRLVGQMLTDGLYQARMVDTERGVSKADDILEEIEDLMRHGTGELFPEEVPMSQLMLEQVADYAEWLAGATRDADWSDAEKVLEGIQNDGYAAMARATSGDGIDGLDLDVSERLIELLGEQAMPDILDVSPPHPLHVPTTGTTTRRLDLPSPEDVNRVEDLPIVNRPYAESDIRLLATEVQQGKYVSPGQVLDDYIDTLMLRGEELLFSSVDSVARDLKAKTYTPAPGAKVWRVVRDETTGRMAGVEELTQDSGLVSATDELVEVPERLSSDQVRRSVISGETQPFLRPITGRERHDAIKALERELEDMTKVAASGEVPDPITMDYVATAPQTFDDFLAYVHNTTSEDGVFDPFVEAVFDRVRNHPSNEIKEMEPLLRRLVAGRGRDVYGRRRLVTTTKRIRLAKHRQSMGAESFTDDEMAVLATRLPEQVFDKLQTPKTRSFLGEMWNFGFAYLMTPVVDYLVREPFFFLYYTRATKTARARLLAQHPELGPILDKIENTVGTLKISNTGATRPSRFKRDGYGSIVEIGEDRARLMETWKPNREGASPTPLTETGDERVDALLARSRPIDPRVLDTPEGRWYWQEFLPAVLDQIPPQNIEEVYRVMGGPRVDAPTDPGRRSVLNRRAERDQTLSLTGDVPSQPQPDLGDLADALAREEPPDIDYEPIDHMGFPLYAPLDEADALERSEDVVSEARAAMGAEDERVLVDVEEVVEGEGGEEVLQRLEDLDEWFDRAYDRILQGEEQVHDAAMTAAVDNMRRYTDNEANETLFSAKYRNLFPFFWAQERFIKRFMSSALYNPAGLARAQRTVIGLNNSIVVEKDESGNPIFQYPLTPELMEVVGYFIQTRGNADGFKLPPELLEQIEVTGRLDRLLPTDYAENYIPNPNFLVGVTGEWLIDMYPEMQPMIDAIRGDINVNARTGDPDDALIVKGFQAGLPSSVQRVLLALNEDELLTVYADRTFAAMVYMHNNGMAPPSDAEPEERNAYFDRVRTLAKQMVSLQVMFGFLGPTPGNVRVDPDAPVAKLREYMSRYGFERALEAWQNDYPNETAFTMFETETAGGAAIPATRSVHDFLVINENLADNHEAAIGYLLPHEQYTGEFFGPAWALQQRLGLRSSRFESAEGAEGFIGNIHESLEFDAWAPRYFDKMEWYDEQIEQARLVGDSQRRQLLQNAKARAKETYYEDHPIFARGMADHSSSTLKRIDTLEQMKVLRDRYEAGDEEVLRLVESGPDGRNPRVELTFELLDWFEEYQSGMTAIQDFSSGYADPTRASFKQAFLEAGEALVDQHPDELRMFWERVILPEIQNVSDEDAQAELVGRP